MVRGDEWIGVEALHQGRGRMQPQTFAGQRKRHGVQGLVDADMALAWVSARLSPIPGGLSWQGTRHDTPFAPRRGERGRA